MFAITGTVFSEFPALARNPKMTDPADVSRAICAHNMHGTLEIKVRACSNSVIRRRRAPARKVTNGLAR